MKEQFEIKLIEKDYIEDILSLQEEVFLEGYTEDRLRRNTINSFNEAFEDGHIAYGVFHCGKLIAFAIMQINPKSKILSSLEMKNLYDKCEIKVDNNSKNSNYAVIKLVIVEKEYRGNGLQVTFLQKFEERLKELKIPLVIASVSPLNEYSLKNFLIMDYKAYITKKLYGGFDRVIVFKKIDL